MFYFWSSLAAISDIVRFVAWSRKSVHFDKTVDNNNFPVLLHVMRVCKMNVLLDFYHPLCIINRFCVSFPSPCTFEEKL